MTLPHLTPAAVSAARDLGPALARVEGSAPALAARHPRPDGPEQGVLWEASSLRALGPEPVATPPGSDLESWVHQFAQAVVEVVAGHRPAAQLRRWTTRSVFDDLERRTVLARRAAIAARPAAQRSALRPQVRSVHLCDLGAEVVEASVHVRHGHRSRAVAMRFEVRRDRWTCTAVEFA